MDFPKKPDKYGFLLYPIASHGSVIHDLVVASTSGYLKRGIGGLSFDLSARTTRKRKRTETGATATNVNFLAIKSLVYELVSKLVIPFNG